MSSPLHIRRMRAAVRRVKAGGERFLGGVLPEASARRLQIRAFADEWAAANLDARRERGPLWVVLGDSASQGIGATTRQMGYVGVVHEMLRHRGAWRVVNLSRAGAGVADVLARQLPELAALVAEEPATLVSCIIGAEDFARHTPGLDISLRQVLAALPAGAIVATVATSAHDPVDTLIREAAVLRDLRVVELPCLPRGPHAAALGDVEHATWAAAFLAALDGRAARRPVVPAQVSGDTAVDR